MPSAQPQPANTRLERLRKKTFQIGGHVNCFLLVLNHRILIIGNFIDVIVIHTLNTY